MKLKGTNRRKSILRDYLKAKAAMAIAKEEMDLAKEHLRIEFGEIPEGEKVQVGPYLISRKHIQVPERTLKASEYDRYDVKGTE